MDFIIIIIFIIIIFFCLFVWGGRKAGREGRRTVGRKEGMKEGREEAGRGDREEGKKKRIKAEPLVDDDAVDEDGSPGGAWGRGSQRF